MLTKMFKKKRRIPTYNLKPRPVTKSRSFEISKRRSTSFFSRIKKTLLLAILLAGLIFFIYSIFVSSFFTIQEIVMNNKNFENEAIADQIKTTLKTSLAKNIFIINTTDLENKILSAFPELDKVSVSKSFPHSLSVNFSEYPMVANVINESNVIKKNYIINSVGFAVKEDLENPNLPYIKVKTDEPINPKQAVIEKDKLNYMMEAKNYFEDKFGMKITGIEYKLIAREIHLHTEKNFDIWLDIQIPYEEQFKKLKKAIVKLDIYKENLEYIDLRIAGNNGDKIIYKRRT